MKKIVFVNRYYDPDQSATSQMLTDLARGMAARGLEVHVVCSRQLYDDPDAGLLEREMRVGVHVHRVATTRFGRARFAGRAVDYAAFYVASFILLSSLLHPGDILVAKTDPPLLSIMAAPVAWLRRAALINWQQDVFPEVATRLGANPLPEWLDLLLRRLRDASLRSATVNVSIGSRMREYLAGRGIPDSKLCVIENWADGAAIRPKPASTSALRIKHALLDRFVACYSGNLGRAHEYQTLLGAADLLKEHENFVFLMIGGGSGMAGLKEEAALRGLDNILFLPHQPRDTLEDSLAAADVHIVSLLPSLEGLIVPSKAYGILAAGRAMIFIGDPDGEIGRIIESSRSGRRVRVGDACALAEELRHMAANPGMRIEMGVRARQLFLDQYEMPRALVRWLAVIDAV